MLDFLVLGLLARTTFRAFCWSADTKSISVSDMITSESAGPESSRVWSSNWTQAVILVWLALMCSIGNFCHYRLNKYPPPPPPPLKDQVTELVEGVFVYSRQQNAASRLCRRQQAGSGPPQPDGAYRSAEDGRIDKRPGAEASTWMGVRLPAWACELPPTRAGCTVTL